MNRKMLVRFLISKGFACREAEDGMEGLSEMSRMRLIQSRQSRLSGANSPVRCLSPRRSLIPDGVPRVVEQHQQQQQQFAIDAVLIDSNMPRMNGPEAIVEMRKIGFRGPIIGVSGGDEKTMKEFLQAGADNVMQKPAQSDKLVSMLLTCLQLVIQEASPRGLTTVTGQARQEHIQRLQKFIEEADAAAKK